MRTLAFALLAPVLLASVLLATPAAAQLPAAPSTAVKPHAPYTLETPIETLMDDPVTLAWLDKHFPGLSERMRDPEVATIFAGSSIDDMSKDPDHGRMLTPEVMAKLKVSLEQAQVAKPPG
jgi:hypothetical protein